MIDNYWEWESCRDGEEHSIVPPAQRLAIASTFKSAMMIISFCVIKNTESIEKEN